jgi:hypothetical protein
MVAAPAADRGRSRVSCSSCARLWPTGVQSARTGWAGVLGGNDNDPTAQEL